MEQKPKKLCPETMYRMRNAECEVNEMVQQNAKPRF